MAAKITSPNNIPKNSMITGSFLKWLAMVSMLIDHVGAMLLEPWLNATGGLAYPDIDWDTLYMAMRLIGRLAFPIFCFLIVEGYHHTHDVKQYAKRLLIFAFISEIPFNLGVNQTLFDFGHQNVFFTLLAGLLAIWALEKVENRWQRLVAIALLVSLAELLNTDYGAYGVIMILLLHWTRRNRRIQVAVGALFNLAQMTAALAFIPIYFYNGKKGRGNAKWLYWFYPVHILILALIYQYFLMPG